MSKAGSRSSAFTASATDRACSTVWPLRERIFSTPLQTIRSSSTTNTRITLVSVIMASTSVLTLTIYESNSSAVMAPTGC